MDHDFTSASRFCHSCGVDGWEAASGPEAFICPGPKPAGNTGRHEDSILWDRLRADLNNLGAAYGEMPTTEAVEYWSCARCHTAGIREGDPCQCDYETVAAIRRRSEPDLNLYYDGIILAARKRREAHSRRNDVEYWNALGAREAATNATADTLSAAMSRPLSFPKRLGWKPGDCE